MRNIRAFAMVALAVAGTGCSLLLDRSSTQCKTDNDCARYGSHPLCQSGVCVASGLGPEGCFYGTPATQADYLNACSTAACVPFDNCGRLDSCGPDGGMPATVDPTNGAIPPLVNPVPTPTARAAPRART